MDIYFSDFTEDAQKRILEFLEIDTEEEFNWNVFPVFVLEKPEE